MCRFRIPGRIRGDQESVPLDVVGVYTARHRREVETMDVETVQPRQIREVVKLMPTEPGQK